MMMILSQCYVCISGMSPRKTTFLLAIFMNIKLCVFGSSVLYDTGYLREYDAFRNVLPYMFTVPQNSRKAVFMFRASQTPDSCDVRKVQIQLQYGSLPLGKNETFPDSYYLDRTDTREINIHSDNKTRQLEELHPLPGDWFAIAYIPDKDTTLRPKGLFPTCYYKFHVEFTASVEEDIDEIHQNHNYIGSISSGRTVIYRFNVDENTQTYQILISDCADILGTNVNCSLSIYTRGQGIPDHSHHDYQYNCSNTDPCTVDVPVLYQYGSQYIMFTSPKNLTFSFNISSMDCESYEKSTTKKTCIMYPLLDRYEYQGVFKTRYMQIIIGTEVKQPYMMSENLTLIVPYEIRSGIDNGGSLIVKLIAVTDKQSKSSDVEVMLKTCIHRTMPDRSIGSDCPASAAELKVNTTSSPVLMDSVIVPYPKAGTWFTSLTMSCFIKGTNNSVDMVTCGNRTVNATLDIQTDRCVEGKCNDKGNCAVYLQGRLLVSTCVCQGGWSGYSCADGSDLISYHEQMLELVLLVTSHVMFIPAIILALYRQHYVQSFVYLYTMFFSAFYHACDGNRNIEYEYCLVDLPVLSFCDFLGSLTSIWVTLVAMTKLPRIITSVFYIAAPLLFAAGIEWERTSMYLFVIPGALGLVLIAVVWAFRCYKRHKCYPPCKRYLLCLLPGLLIAGGGLCIFAFAENSKNYKYTHSAWHMLMATCTLFLLPPRKKKRELRLDSNNQYAVECLADDPNSTPLTSFGDRDSTENLIL